MSCSEFLMIYCCEYMVCVWECMSLAAVSMRHVSIFDYSWNANIRSCFTSLQKHSMELIWFQLKYLNFKFLPRLLPVRLRCMPIEYIIKIFVCEYLLKLFGFRTDYKVENKICFRNFVTSLIIIGYIFVLTFNKLKY